MVNILELKPILLEGDLGKYEWHGRYRYVVNWRVDGRQGEEHEADIATIVGKMFKIYQERKCTESDFGPYSNYRLCPQIFPANDYELSIFNSLFELRYSKKKPTPGNITSDENLLKKVS